MIVRDILQVKGQVVYSISPDATLADVCRELVNCNCGSLVVCDGEQSLIGIITERDVLRAMAQDALPLELIRVEARMSTELFTASPDEGLETVMGLMTEKRIRHLPVVDRGQLLGVISIGDVVKAHHDRLCMENEYLKHYIYA